MGLASVQSAEALSSMATPLQTDLQTITFMIKRIAMKKATGLVLI